MTDVGAGGPDVADAHGACGGIQLDGPIGREFRPLAAQPLGRAAVVERPLDPPTGSLHWQIDVPGPAGGPGTVQRQRMWADGDRRVLELGGRPVVEIDLQKQTVAHADCPTPIVVQAVAAVAMPLLVTDLGGHVFHGSAAVIDGAATLLIGPSGSGKSSLLVALARAGHRPLTEDACVVGAWSEPVIWPGPPWVRLAADAPPPDGWSLHFDALDKRGWQLPDQPDTPQPIGRVVLLRPPQSGPPCWERLPTPEAIAALAQHVTWLGDPAGRLAGAFAAAVRLATSAPVHVLRIEHRADWVDEALAVLAR
jgi:hypothetical protein